MIGINMGGIMVTMDMAIMVTIRTMATRDMVIGVTTITEDITDITTEDIMGVITGTTEEKVTGGTIKGEERKSRGILTVPMGTRTTGLATEVTTGRITTGSTGTTGANRGTALMGTRDGVDMVTTGIGTKEAMVIIMEDTEDMVITRIGGKTVITRVEDESGLIPAGLGP